MSMLLLLFLLGMTVLRCSARLAMYMSSLGLFARITSVTPLDADAKGGGREGGGILGGGMTEGGRGMLGGEIVRGEGGIRMGWR